jgi:hypothetical protein
VYGQITGPPRAAQVDGGQTPVPVGAGTADGGCGKSPAIRMRETHSAF